MTLPAPAPGSPRLLWRWLPVVAVVLVLLGLAAALSAPPDALQGDLQRLMYVHVPSAWLAFLSFAVTCAGSIAWLVRRSPVADRLAASAAEVGVFFTGLAICLGSLWGKPVWGTWWTWDPRLVTTAILFFVYLGYLAVRRGAPDVDARARRSAVYGVVAVIQLPVVYLSVLWWRSLHQPPSVLRAGGPTMDPRMLTALLVNVVAFTAVWAVLVHLRMRLAAAEDLVSSAALDQPAAGTAVTAPLPRSAS